VNGVCTETKTCTTNSDCSKTGYCGAAGICAECDSSTTDCGGLIYIAIAGNICPDEHLITDEDECEAAL
jgi:hypothetical protein